MWVTRHRPDPAGGGGAVAEYELLRAVSARAHHEITVVTGGSPVGLDGAPVGLDGAPVVAVGCDPPRRRGRLAAVRHLAPLPVADVAGCTRALAAAAVELEARRPFDVVHIWPGEVAAVAAAVRSPSLLLLPDCYTRQAARERDRAANGRQKVLWAIETAKARRWEARSYRRASALACLSPVDAPALAALTGRPVALVPLPIGDEWFEEPGGERDGTVVFVGALDYRPNVEGLAWLADEIWPRLRAARPGAALWVVGRNPVQSVRDAVARCGGELVADVPDARPWYWGAGVVVSPVRLGSGTRNKVLHAFASRTPLVSTSASVEGIPCTPGDHLLVADTADAFADAVAATLSEPQRAAARAAAARSVAERYRAEAAAAALEEAWARCGSSS